MKAKRKKQVKKRIRVKGENFQIWNTDAIDLLKLIPENSIDSIIVDGPYNLAFMGSTWDSFKVEATAKSAGGFGKNSKTNENQFAAARVRYSADLTSNLAFEAWNTEWALEAIRVLKPGGFLLAFGCTKTEHRLVSGIENAGFEVRDKISWWYATGSPKGVNLKDENAGKGTGLSPAVEFIGVFRKPISEKTILANVLKWGTGCYNIDSCRIIRDKEDIPGRHKTGANGSNGYRETNTFKIRAMPAKEIRARCNKGRWPKNVLLSHSPDCRVIEKKCVEGCPILELEKQKPGASRFFFTSKPAKSERDAGLDSLEEKKWIQYQTANGTSGKASSLSAGRNTVRRNLHPCIKPVKLMEYLIKLITPENGLVLDCFMGSGTTGVAVLNLGYRFIGCDSNKEYFDIAKLRLIHAEKNQ